MKRNLKLIAVCAFLVLSCGFFAGNIYAEGSDIAIDTNGNVEINGDTNTVTISPNGNGPLVINNINLPNQNLVISGDARNQPLISFQGNTNPGPVIQTFAQNNMPTLISTGSIQIPQGLEPVKPQPADSNAAVFPMIVELEKPHSTEEPVNWSSAEKHSPSSGATLSAAVTSTIAAGTPNLSEPIYINIQDVQEASQMSSNAAGDIVLQ